MATFEQQDTNTVRLKLTSNLQSSNEFVDKWYFNLNPSLNAADLAFAKVSLGNVGKAPKINYHDDAFNGQGGSGKFDIQFNFSNSKHDSGSNQFRQGSEVVYDISMAGGLTEADFNFQSVGSKLPSAPISVAKVRGTGSKGRDTGDIMNSAPAPTGIVLAASGLPILLVGSRLRRRNRAGEL